MFDIERSTQFKKDYKNIKKRNYDMKLLHDVIRILTNGEKLPAKYKDHALKGNLKRFRECHIKPDWLLVYKINNKKLILYLSRTGSHSDIEFS